MDFNYVFISDMDSKEKQSVKEQVEGAVAGGHLDLGECPSVEVIVNPDPLNHTFLATVKYCGKRTSITGKI